MFLEHEFDCIFETYLHYKKKFRKKLSDWIYSYI